QGGRVRVHDRHHLPRGRILLQRVAAARREDQTAHQQAFHVWKDRRVAPRTRGSGGASGAELDLRPHEDRAPARRKIPRLLVAAAERVLAASGAPEDGSNPGFVTSVWRYV